MRTLRTVAMFREAGISRAELRWGLRNGRWRRMVHGVYGDGPEPPTASDVGRAIALATAGIAAGELAGRLHGLDGVSENTPAKLEVLVTSGLSGSRPGVRRLGVLPAEVAIVEQVFCLDGRATLWDLTRVLDDLRWEQALESALRKGLVVADDVRSWVHRDRARAARVCRVLALRDGPETPPTESLLETLMVQLLRQIPGLSAPRRQVNVYDADGRWVARVDLAWPELGLFLELDGQHHLQQPVYDARRETAVVAATGWLCGRFTWHEVRRLPGPTGRRVAALVAQARRRPMGSPDAVPA